MLQRATTAHALARMLLLTLAAIAVAALPAACGPNIERATPRPQAQAARGFTLTVDPILRGTIASESIILGYQPVVVRGYGLVVNLKGTGSGDVPPNIRAHMIAEMSRRGVGRETQGAGGISPEEMLMSENTAVVIVEAVIPPGSVGPVRSADGRVLRDGTTFDVRVYADPRTGTTSLEGGQLYTTELRPGPLTTGRAQARALAAARGPIFMNPFAEPGAVGRDAIDRRSGRILDGGYAIRDLPIKLRLATPSHTRAEIVQNAINARFPQEPGQRERTAHGESDEAIRINVPPSYRGDPETFINLMRHTSIRLSGQEAIAHSVMRAVQADPSISTAATWRWRALGRRVLPIIQELYDDAEEAPRLAALRAGGALNDPMAFRPLIDMAQNASTSTLRIEAVRILGDMRNHPAVDSALRELVSDRHVEVRLSSYEALVKHNDPALTRYNVDGKFYLDIIESDYPMIYITQFGDPRIALFGRDLDIEMPLTFTAWSNRMIVKGDVDKEKVEVYYRDVNAIQGSTHQVANNLESFVHFLAHRTTVDRPIPGLNLTYTETVGALHQLWSKKHINADFKADQDRILVAIAEQEQTARAEDRPEFDDPDFDYLRQSNANDPFWQGESSDDGALPTSDLMNVAPPVGNRPESNGRR